MKTPKVPTGQKYFTFHKEHISESHIPYFNASLKAVLSFDLFEIYRRIYNARKAIPVTDRGGL
jgi:hypothetical protein